MTDRPIIFSGPMVRALLAGRKTQTRRLATSPLRKCEIGDRLYVRESFQLHDKASDVCLIAYGASVKHSGWNEAHNQFPVHLCGDMRPKPFQQGLRPSIHMPRWASRLTLTVTENRSQKLHQTSPADILAEGIGLDGASTYQNAWIKLWNDLHDKDGVRWWDNPDIVALTFTVEDRNIDQ